MTEYVTVLGLKEMRKALMEKVPVEMQGKVLQKALVAAARPVVEAAKRFAPGTNTPTKDPKRPNTGILKASIHSEKDRTNSNGVMESRAIRVRSRRAGKRIRSFEKKRGKKYTDRNRGSGAPYWWYVEFGTRKQPGQRFLTRGFDSTKMQAFNELQRGLQDALVEAIRKARWQTPRV